MSQKRVFNTNAEHIYVNDVPEYNLDLVNARSIDPAYSFTRNSSATYVGPDGLIKTAGINQPRFDYDPVTGEYKGLLIEESRTNLAPNSIAALSNTTLSNVIAPDGTLTARDWDGVSNTGSIHGSFPNTDTIYTVSFFVRQIDNTSTAFRARSWGGAPSTRLDLIYNLATDTISSFSNSNSAGGTGTTMTPTLKVEFFNDGWRRISMTGYIRNESGFYFNETGTTKTTYQLWGFQVEQGSFPTSYIPTSGSAVTRQPDQLVLNKTLNTQGTFFIESNPSQGVPLVAGDASPTLSILQPNNQYTKSVLYYNNNRTLRMASDDSVPTEVNGLTPRSINNISLGYNSFNNISYINGYLKKFSYYSSPLSEDNLRALTGNSVPVSRATTAGNVFALGGTVTEITQNGLIYRVHTFTTVGTSELIIENGGEVEYLIVGGGGQGGTSIGGFENGGGGGAGGFIEGSKVIDANIYSIIVGDGGPRSSGNSGQIAGNSSAFSLTAFGGGSGALSGNIKSGGSGAGGSAFGNRTGGTATQPTSSSGGFGNGGGFGHPTGDAGAGGGGGAGSAGGNGTSTIAGAGGEGLQSSITGEVKFYAAGGGGGTGRSSVSALGGSGIGGNGGTSSSRAGQDATPSTGSGGGGGNSQTSGGAGGSGIVIVRYPIGVA